MSRPNADVDQPVETSARKAPPQVGGIDPTLAATGVFDSGAHAAKSDEATLQATLALTPAQAPSAADDATVEVTNLAFPRPHHGPDPGATVEMAPTIPPRRLRPSASDQDSAPTLDSEGKTNAFSISSVDGSAEIVLNDLPHVAGYRLISELGRGGMGVVYRARQERLDRDVALKMVLAGAHASADQLARFLIEAQAVAHLTHQNIVQIYDVGERDHLPFFSLEYIDGGSLQQTINSKPQPVRYAARTVKTLCEAMAFAHDKGIIHRDLKPANVLMTKAGEPKITDFGLAKRLEGDSQQTRDGAIMGTPSYMAPEQAWGLTSEIGPQADQHAMGAILYEMLTGRPPYQGANPLDTLDQVRNQEPVPPSRLQPKVPKDLETICLKAIQKDANKRYATCTEMAEDLGRFLEEKPILARPVGLPEQAWRWCKRNPKLAKAYAGVATLIVAGFIGTAVFAVIVAKKNTDLTIAKKAEEKAKDEALKREAATRALATAGIDLTNTMIENGRYLSIVANWRLRELPGTLDIRRELFKVALLSIQRVEKDMEKLREQKASNAATDALTLRTMAGVHQSRGIIHAEMGPRYADKVWPEFDEMKRIAEKHYKLAPEDLEAIKNMAVTRMTLGDYTWRLKADKTAAEAYFLDALKFRKMWLEKFPDDDNAKQAMCNALGRLAKLYQETGEPAKALPFYEQEEVARASVSLNRITDTEFRRETAGLYEKLGDLNIRLGNAPKGLEFYEKSHESRVDFDKEFPDHPQGKRDIMLSLHKLGNYYQINAKDLPRALKYYQDGLAIARLRIQADRESAINLRDLALSLYFLGTTQKEMHDIPASDKSYEEYLTISQSLVKPNVPLSQSNDVNAQAYINWMLGLARCGRHAEASKIASDLAALPPGNGYTLFQAACGYALSAEAAERADPDKKDLAKSYRSAAFSALRGALLKGWKSPEEIATDPDLEPLRSDPAYPALMIEVRKAAQPK